MIVKQKRDIKLFVIQFGAALAISFAGFFYSRFRNKRIKPPPPPLPLDHGSDSEAESRGGRAVHQDHLNSCVSMQKGALDNSMADLFPNSRHTNESIDQLIDFKESNLTVSKEVDPISVSCHRFELLSQETVDYEKEIKQLRNTVKMLQEKESNLESKLIEYYGLKEQQKAAMELQNRLKLNQMETKLLNLKIESLQAENKALNTQLDDHAKIVAELEASRSQIKLLKKKLRIEAQQNKEWVISLKERVAKLHEQDTKACVKSLGPDAETTVQRLRDLEAEIDELRKSNTKLLRENTDLAGRLESAQILANSRLEDPEIEVLTEDCGRLRHENEDLKREIEQLQADRCTDLEELVYLRWINACLRYELRNYQPPTGKAVARDLSKTLSPKSEEKAKKLILEYAHTEGFDEKGMDMMEFDYDQWSSSQDSFMTDSADLDDSSIDTSSASKTNKSGKKSLLGKLRKLIHGKDSHHHSKHEHWNPLSCSSSTAVHTIPGSQSSRFAARRPNYRHSMDFQMLMRNKRDEFKDVGSGSGHKSATGSFVYNPLDLHGKSYSDLGNESSMDMNPEPSGRSELRKYAKALKTTHPAKKLHKKSASYCFGDM